MSARADAVRGWDRAGTLAERLIAVGALNRVACSDEDEHGDLVTRADAALELARASLAERVNSARIAVPSDAAVRSWLAAPHGAPASAIQALADLGALAGGLAVVSPAHPDRPALDAHVAALAADLTRPPARSLVAGAELASRFVVEHGVAPGPDDALLALADALGEFLTEALAGRPLVEPRYRVRPVAADLAAQIARALGEALSAKLTPSADLFELASFAVPERASELTLHRDERHEAVDLGFEMLPGVTVRRPEPHVLVVTAPDAETRVLVVPFVGGQPAPACPSRIGATARERVFDVVPEDELDTYALVVGDRVAFFAMR